MPLNRLQSKSLTIPIPPTPPLTSTVSTSVHETSQASAYSALPRYHRNSSTPSPPSALHSPIRSPLNPFLISPQASLNAHALFLMASPLLPASPLSLFDQAVSPGTTTLPLPCTLSPTQAVFLLPASPLSPRFLFPQEPPCLPRAKRAQNVPKSFSRKGSIVGMIRSKKSTGSEFAGCVTGTQESSNEEYARVSQKKRDAGTLNMRELWSRLFAGIEGGGAAR